MRRNALDRMSQERDRVSITGIRCAGRHGAYPGEKDREQPFLLAIHMDVDLSAASRSDALADTVDYAAVYETIVSTVRTTSFDLLERLADEIFVRLFSDARIASAELSIGKPELLDGATASITLHRTNPRSL